MKVEPQESSAVLIAAISGRGLAQSARRAGYIPLVLDAFGDLDTAAACYVCRTLTSGGEDLDTDHVVPELERLAALSPHQPEGVVYGSGFESRMNLLTEIGHRWPLLGNTAQVVGRIKDPLSFAELCANAGVAHPAITRTPPSNTEAWLTKRVGGAGGRHVVAYAAGPLRQNTYAQRRVEGRSVSALFVANGRDMLMLGLSEQWTAPGPGQPYRFGGAVRPAAINKAREEMIADWISRIVRMTGLVGINSADFLIGEIATWLIEINPRPGATLDIFDNEDGHLFGLHLAACRGRIPRTVPIFATATAAAIAYCQGEITSVPHVIWPEWILDRPKPGTRVAPGGPVCTVVARAPTSREARATVEARLQETAKLIGRASAWSGR